MLHDSADLNHDQIFKVPLIVPKGLHSLPYLLVNCFPVWDWIEHANG